VVICLSAIMAALAIGASFRRDLWVDEIFSIALATGHSLEHPAAVAVPAEGDFVESPVAMPATAIRRYAEHDASPAGVRRVLRAVHLSDTSPPLYYIVLNGWTRVSGTSDLALRLFSIVFALLCMPLVAALARRLGGRGAVIPSCAFFALAPQSVYYASEGRMYSMLLFLVLAMALLTLDLHRRGAKAATASLWVIVSAAGLVTHYFFLFPWGAATLWLLLHPHRLDRRHLFAMIAVVPLLVLPWFVRLPAQMAAWRITKGWLNVKPDSFNGLSAQLNLFWSYFYISGGWSYVREHPKSFLMATIGLAVFAGVWAARGRIVSQRWQFLWLWLVAPSVGLWAFDLLQHTYTRDVSRYAIAGMPAAFLLVGLALARLPFGARAVATAAIVAQWLPTYWAVFTRDVQNTPRFRAAAQAISRRSDDRDVVIVHSIPSGVLEIARYLESQASVASWVGELGTRRVPDDVAALTAGRRRVFVVSYHDMGEPLVEETYLRAHATAVDDAELRALKVREYVLRDSANAETALGEDRPPRR
jgi:hypothetical protein